MTVTITEFRKNFSYYERIAVSEPVIIVNKKTGTCYTFKGDNPMKKRLEDMRSGKYSTTEEVLALAEE